MSIEAPDLIPLCRPIFGDDEIASVAECLRSGWVTSGPKVAEFERSFAALCGTEEALATSSGTAALHLALLSLDLRPGDEVITPALTWVSVPNLVALLGARPVFCEVDPATLNIDVADAARLITERTRAIVPVHFAGRPVDLSAVHALATTRDIVVIEDACHAIGSRYADRPIGSHSDLVAFSFHPNKNISTGEGGMLTGRDRARLSRARELRYHGVTRNSFAPVSGRQLPYYDDVRPGLKYIMTDIAASIGLCQLTKLERFNQARASIAERYREALAPLANYIWIPPDETTLANRHSWHLFTIRVKERDGLRDAVMQGLLDSGIGVGLHYRPVHEMVWVRQRGLACSLPVTESIGKTILSLPLYPDLTNEQVQRVVDALRAVLLRISG